MSENQTQPVIVSPEVFGKLPGLILISGIAEMDPVRQPDLSAIKSYLNQSWQSLQQKVVDANSEESKRIQTWVEALKAAGVKTKDFPPSIQAISKRALKGGGPFSINSIVDTYNAISMELALPLGAYDLDGLDGDLRLRLSSGGENFMAIGSGENDPTLPSEIVYSDGADILTRMFLWRQSNKAKITSETKKFIFVCELLNAMAPELPEKVKEVIVEKMQNLLGAKISDLTLQDGK